MYDKHNPPIAAGMRSDPETFARGVLFSCMSARQPIITVPDMMRDVDRHGGDAKSLALPNKLACWEYLQAHATRTWEATLERPTGAALEYLAREVPGLGIVKAAFVLQLAGRDIACLDSHNLRKLGMREKFFKLGRKDGHKNPTRPKLAKYLELAAGKSRQFWDEWCIDRAAFYERTPDDISALHLAIIN